MSLTQISTAGVKDDAVTSGKIPANAVGSSEIAANAVGTSEIAGDAVTSTELAANAVTTVKINNDAVNNSKLAANSVSTVKIADEAVTLAKLPHGTSSNDGKFLRANNGADPSFETVTSTTINNNADNRVITGSGSANTLNAESTLTWNGTLLDINQSGTVDTGLKLRNSEGGLYVRANDDKTFIDTDQLIVRNEASTERLRVDASGNVGIGTATPESRFHIRGSSGDGDLFSISDITVPTSGDEYGVAMIKSNAAANMLSLTGYNSNSKGLRIYNNGGSAGRTSFEIAQASGTKFLVDGVGRVMIGTTTEGFGTYGEEFTLAAADHAGMTIRTGTGHKGSIYFSDGTSGDAEYRGGVQYDHSDDSLRLSASAANRVRIDSDGLKFGSDTAANNAIDDFEKGSWTPRIGPDGVNTVYESGEGTYTKVGDKVTVYYAFRNKNPNSFGNGVVRIWNLPYNIRHAANHNSAHDYGTCEMLYNITFNNNGKVFFYTENNNSEIIGLESRTGTTWVNWNTNSFANNFYLHGHITYFTDNY